MSAWTESTLLLEASDLTVRFGKVTALDGFDLVAPPGEVLAILGPNGAGKTTFVRTVATLVPPTRGNCGCVAPTSPATRSRFVEPSVWLASTRRSSPP